MDFLGVKIFFNSGSKTLFLGSLVGVFSSVLCVSASVIDRSFCSRIACVISLSLLELFLSHLFVSCFCSPFAFKRPFLGVCLV
ncbi:hypothetical protein FE359_06940 [Helicobacter pylori]|uniref:hypothetical protein n=1 Tax=Helicobacter pylori TaxID=210 RepID=UPI0013E3C043|nr:hypothetical protein [Helicobacter pylori]WQW94949.1 hypothetical protein FE359_06940 [Helicobacter pylori]